MVGFKQRDEVLEQLLFRDKLGFIVCCPDGPMISKYNNGPKLTYRRPRMLSTYIVMTKFLLGGEAFVKESSSIQEVLVFFQL